MLIYGSKAVHLRSEQSQTSTCPNCGTKGSLVLSVFRRHAHIFWIPLFPIGKKGMSKCLNCQNVLEVKDMDESLKREYDRVKDASRGPIWQFVGIVLIALLVAWAYYSIKQDKKMELTYVSAPQSGDVYEYKLDNDRYSALKVVDVSEDSVFVVQNVYEINKRAKVDEIDEPENYSTESYGISKEQLKGMYDSKVIVNIKR